jgi:hypothetical protein
MKLKRWRFGSFVIGEMPPPLVEERICPSSAPTVGSMSPGRHA